MLEMLALALLQASPAAADYPFRALREGREGVTEFGVRTNPQGLVIECWIIRSSGSPDLDAATCRVAIRRIKVAPPLDGQGQPQPAQWTSRMEWRIDGSGPAQASPQRLTETAQ
ncbi:MAG: energy transducer TonB [Sphingomonadaceae bacterium]|nr:energy transducer TonB [Sphingomonadaceae bacterium]